MEAKVLIMMSVHRGLLVWALLGLGVACRTGNEDTPSSKDQLGDVAPPSAASAADSGTSDARSIDAFVAAQMQTHHREGVQIALLKNGATVFSKGYGKADVARNVSVTERTIFPVSSMSKVVMVVAVLQVLESVATARATTLDALLDADVDTLVRTGDTDPLHVRQPGHPDAPITMRMLLSHTSGIQNRYSLIPHNFPVTGPAYDHSAVPDLRLVHQGYLVPGGTYFHAQNFLDGAPGTQYLYSSVASSIAALVVRAQMNVSFEEWTRTHVFEPLGMGETAWRLSDMAGLRDGSRVLALPYQFAGTANALVDPPIWEHTFYPAASLRSTAEDYAKLVGALTNDGTHAGGRLLQAATMTELRRVQNKPLDSAQCLIVYWKKLAGFWLLGHGGANDGYLSDASFMVKSEKLADGSAPTDLWGTVVLTNGDYSADNKDLIGDVESEMLRRALANESL